MEEVVLSALFPDGMCRRRVIADVEIAHPVRYFPIIPAGGRLRQNLQVISGVDEGLGIHSLELTWPVYGAWDVAVHGPRKFRRLMFVHTVYAGRVSECIELARDAFFLGTRFVPGFAFMRELPKGAEAGMDVHGVLLFAADWMPGSCVAVGGR